MILHPINKEAITDAMLLRKKWPMHGLEKLIK